MNERRAELADRIRAMLSGERVEQKRMFGSLAFMVDERLLVAAWGDGDLLVRVDPERSPELQLLPGARQAEMGAARRSMGPSWLSVDADAIADDDRLLFWIDVAREHHASR
ncbi:TfoX/Sxy family protein [Microbacterium sp. No. 7]|uniref:TfoX/Sxy family protein n=1 Tax=Microbacterium sp. No. 7 TaxID=1714373 RepID=UPI0006D1CF6F|nr:TfoX/Sxy family protein [Microbacterium sp. No. 7]ALJ20764.1 hypothetical protein AOA12_12975 [Microbacterium sp. No. 7]